MRHDRVDVLDQMNKARFLTTFLCLSSIETLHNSEALQMPWGSKSLDSCSNLLTDSSGADGAVGQERGTPVSGAYQDQQAATLSCGQGKEGLLVYTHALSIETGAFCL